MASKKPPSLKTLVIGASGVGKSSLMQRFVSDTFSEDTLATIGVDVRQKKIPLSEEGGDIVTMAIFDTAGSEQYRSLASSYYRNAHVALLVYDVTKQASFDALDGWLKEVQSFVPDVTLMLVANKIDLLAEDAAANSNADEIAWRAQEREKAEEFAREHNMMLVRTSAKTREGVSHAFEAAGRKAAQGPVFRQLLEADAAGPKKGAVDLSAEGGAGSGEQQQAGGLGCGCL